MTLLLSLLSSVTFHFQRDLGVRWPSQTAVSCFSLPSSLQLRSAMPVVSYVRRSVLDFKYKLTISSEKELNYFLWFLISFDLVCLKYF